MPGSSTSLQYKTLTSKFVKEISKDEKEEIEKNLTNKLVHVINKLKVSLYLSSNTDFENIRRLLDYDPQLFRTIFSKNMPLTTYSNYKEICERIYLKGGENILSEGRPCHIAKSGGSTGTPKYLPCYNWQTFEKYKEFPTAEIIDIVRLKSGHPKFNSNSKGIELLNKKVWSYSPPDCDVNYEFRTSVGFVSTQICTSNNDIEPLEVKYISNHRDRLFISLLFSLSYRDLEYILTVFMNLVADMLVIMEEDWSSLLECIKTGVILENEFLNAPLDDSLRQQLQSKFVKNEYRYNELNSIFNSEEISHPQFSKILNKIWPKLSLIMGTATGAFEFHLKTVNFYVDKNVTSIIDYIYGSSEAGLLGEPLGLHPNHYIIEEDHCYIEFLEINKGKNSICSPDLEIGKEYELLITNINGWVRYRMEDIFEHKGWYNGYPVMSYVRRCSEEFKIDQAIVNQSTIIKAMDLISQNIQIFNFMCFEDASSRPSKFGFLVELFLDNYYYEGEQCYHTVPSSIITESSVMIDGYLKENSFLYQTMTENGRVGSPVTIKIVPPNSFHLLREYKAKISKSDLLTQIKLPLFSRGVLVDQLLTSSETVQSK